MTLIPVAGSAALQLLLQRSQFSPLTVAAGRNATAEVVAAANGAVPASMAGAGLPNSRTEISDAIYSVNSVDANKLKVNLTERLGAEFGISADDFESASAFGTAIKHALDAMKQDDGWQRRVAEIERNLGLDELGISLDSFINALINSDNDDAAKLDAALRDKVDDDAQRARFTLDDIGIYGR
ncbi:hypothetical protein [Mesorhizobium sp. CAU 1732]|uniref:hypothetical protein n=1 Tax=Mesorhizobium sp. CAU 1732 TaxID=3140358 RepID=UPI0032602103